jgi:hypothetical protein
MSLVTYATRSAEESETPAPSSYHYKKDDDTIRNIYPIQSNLTTASSSYMFKNSIVPPSTIKGVDIDNDVSTKKVEDLMKPHVIVCSPVRRPSFDTNDMRLESCLTEEELAWVQDAVDVSLGHRR